MSHSERNAIIYYFYEFSPSFIKAVCLEYPRLQRKILRRLVHEWGHRDLGDYGRLLSGFERIAEHLLVQKKVFIFEKGLDEVVQMACKFKDVESICGFVQTLKPVSLNSKFGQEIVGRAFLSNVWYESNGFELAKGVLDSDSAKFLVPRLLDPMVLGAVYLDIQTFWVAGLLSLTESREAKVRNFAYDQLNLVRSTEFGDPRQYRRSHHWKIVGGYEPDNLKRYISLLNEEDFEFFFNEVDLVQDDRKKFWKEYVPSLVDTVVVLPDEKIKEIRQKYSNGNDGEASIRALERVRSFRAGRIGLIFMFFDNVVVIEGTETPSAARFCRIKEFDSYLRPRLSEERGFASILEFNRAFSEVQEKFPSEAVTNRLRHAPRGGWQFKFLTYLSGKNFGVTPG